MAAIVLRGAGHEVATYSSATGLSALILEHEPDVVVLDVNLPEISGPEWLQQARQRELKNASPDPAFVFFSGLPPEELEKLAAENDVAGFISKETGPDGFAKTFCEITSQPRP